MSKGKAAEGLQLRLEEKGREHATLTVATKSVAQPAGKWQAGNKLARRYY